MSRKHAKLTINFDNAFIEDLGSSNGTFVADRKIAESTRLFPNQAIRLGSVTMQLRRLKASGGPESLSPHAAAVRRYLPPDYLRELQYDIGGVIAQGGMGAIVDAQDKLLRRRVAMKVMLQTGSQTDLLRFIEEAQITGQLEHPNIVPVYELGVDEQDQVFYTMKLVRGITLHQVLHLIETGVAETVKKYPLPALLTIFQKVCDALAFAHSKGVIHRDLKPANIMLGEYGEVLVMDWGLARVSGRNEASGVEPERTLVRSARQDEGAEMMTMAGMVLGTPQYMPPEQARGETDHFDARTDIYSLGALLYHILTLEPPIQGEDVQQMLQSVVDGKVAPQVASHGQRRVESSRALPHIPGGKIPEALAEVTRKAMALLQEDRFQTVKELQSAVQGYQIGSTPVRAGTEPASARPAGKMNTVVIVLLMIIALLAGVCVKLAMDRSAAEAALRSKP
ncbi:MAG: FHA domain-containing serine/threonine-protein kinase [Chthoniobacteraceae bacterium]